MADPIVIDAFGARRSMTWAHEKYGPFVIYTAAAGTGSAWEVTALREKNDAAFVATARNAEGSPAPGTRICFYWPDAPTLADAGPMGAPFDGITPSRAVSGYADGDGNVGFGMGPGAHYRPDLGERGPHAAWIHGTNTRSDVILGMGMIPDDHLHLNVEWTLVEGDDNGDDGNGDDDGPEGLAAALIALSTALTGVADALRALSASLTGLADVMEAIANE